MDARAAAELVRAAITGHVDADHEYVIAALDSERADMFAKAACVAALGALVCLGMDLSSGHVAGRTAALLCVCLAFAGYRTRAAVQARGRVRQLSAASSKAFVRMLEVVSGVCGLVRDP